MSPDAHRDAAASPFLPPRPPVWPGRSRPAAWLAIAIVIACAIPLFAGLDRQDIANDEAIYTYAVQRMVETGDWLTPRYVDTDGLFLEKPPLKLWLAALPLRLGLIPNSVAGIRVIDAALGAAALAYVMAFGWRIGGLICGGVALTLLLAYHPLLFTHGLRENNMESALVLSYAAGLFHVVSWTLASTAARRRWHAMGAALWFVLGFMSKFVAALFLPAIALAALCVAPGGWTLLTRRWREWVRPAIVAVGLIVPWFAYQFVVHPDDFWPTIFGGRVYLRFTTYVNPAHVQPWHFYLTDTWTHLGGGTVEYTRAYSAVAPRVLVAAGIVYGLWQLGGPGRGAAGLLLLWWMLPVGLISLGTSKITHYGYPFFPGLALAAGWCCAEGAGRFGRRMADVLQAWREKVSVWQPVRGSLLRRLLLLVAAVCLVVAGLTLVGGPITGSIGELRLFKNSTVLRPMIVAVVLLVWLGQVRVAAAALLVLLLPLEAAGRTFERATTVHHPLWSARTCLLELARSDPGLRRGLYRSDPFDAHLAVHQLYYALRDTGPWVEGMERFNEEVATRLHGDATQTPMLLSVSQWTTLGDSVGGPPSEAPMAFQVVPGVALVLPGPYRVCAGAIDAGGGVKLGRGVAE